MQNNAKPSWIPKIALQFRPPPHKVRDQDLHVIAGSQWSNVLLVVSLGWCYMCTGGRGHDVGPTHLPSQPLIIRFLM